MDSRLVLNVIFVTLCWGCMGTYGQSSTTASPTTASNMTVPSTMATGSNMTANSPMATGSNMTAPVTMATGSNMTAHSTMAPGNNMTAPGTMAPGNNMTAPGTMAPGNNMTATGTMAPGIILTAPGNNMTAPGTMAPGNNMTAPSTMAPGNNMTAPGTMAPGNNMTATGTMAPGIILTAPGNNMTAPGTMAPGNNMTAPSTMAPGNTMTTASTTTTTAAPVSQNTTVVLLETPVSSAECGTQQLCAAEPASCDPSTPGSCFFLAAKQQSGQNFEFGLSGESEGYIAASLSTGATPGSTDPTYVCANNNGEVRFFGTIIENGQLVERNLSVTSVRGRVNGNQIQCTFVATIPDPLLRSTAFSLAVSTGSFNASAGSLGPPSTVIRTPTVDLTNPNATVTNLATTNATTAPMTTATTANAVTHRQSLIPALMFTVAVLLLTMLGGN